MSKVIIKEGYTPVRGPNGSLYFQSDKDKSFSYSWDGALQAGVAKIASNNPANTFPDPSALPPRVGR